MASEVKANKLSPSSGTTVTLGDASETVTLPTGVTCNLVDGLGVAAGGTGLASFTAGDILYATGSTTLAKLSKGTAEQVLAMNSGATAPDWGSVDLTVLPTITVGKGGTNLTSFTAGDFLYATGATTLAKLAKGAATEVIAMNSGATAPEWVAAGGGGVLQVKQTVVTDEVAYSSSSSGTYVDLSEMAVSITPTLSTSKILIYLDAKLYQSMSAWSTIVRLMRDTTAIYVSTDATGDQLQATIGSHNGGVNNVFAVQSLFLDAPASTSAISYNMEWSVEASSVAYLNRPNADTNSNLFWHSASSITAIEIAVGVL